eukprot:2008279-Rhodomonas_salina.2
MVTQRLLLCLVFACALQHARSACTGATNRMAFPSGTLADDCGPKISSDFFTGGDGTLSKVGDLNGDGTDDFAYAQGSNAKIFVFFGSPDSSFANNIAFDGSDGFVLEGEEGEDFGATIAGGFDINSDGFDGTIYSIIALLLTPMTKTDAQRFCRLGGWVSCVEQRGRARVHHLRL